MNTDVLVTKIVVANYQIIVIQNHTFVHLAISKIGHQHTKLSPTSVTIIDYRGA